MDVYPLDRATFGDDFPDGGIAQTEYLWDYLVNIGCRSFVREERYVDRHYLDDFTNYYARKFRVPDPHCRRLHYFAIDSGELDEQLDAFLTGASEKQRQEAAAAIQAAYRGFVVRRPIHRAHIGRSVLATYPPRGDGGTRRQYTAVRSYSVHLGALELSIDGLAYQQQDGGAAVCASTALWCALQKVAHLAGHRTPTPSQITTAAQSPYAASYGLSEAQMASALARLGYAADVFVPGTSRQAFRAKIAASLRSNLPVVLMVDDMHDGHAVTVTGYSDPPGTERVPPYDGADDGLSMRSGTLGVIYVHDDNLGCHAHYELLDEPPDDLKGECYHYGDVTDGVWLLRGRAGGPWPDWWARCGDANKKCLLVSGALVPKPSKLRMPVDDLLQVAWALRHLIAVIFEDLPLRYEVAFRTGVDYQAAMLEIDLDRNELRDFYRETSLPRHMAVISTFDDSDRHLCDFLLDATAVDLDPGSHSFLAVVAPGIPHQSLEYKNLVAVCEDEDVAVPYVTGPAR